VIDGCIYVAQDVHGAWVRARSPEKQQGGHQQHCTASLSALVQSLPLPHTVCTDITIVIGQAFVTVTCKLRAAYRHMK
jgi:hypothetical protein